LARARSSGCGCTNLKGGVYLVDVTRKLVAAWMAFAFILGMMAGVAVYDEAMQEDPETPWQAAMHISNWTNRTLEIDLYVFGGDTLQYSITIDHEENITLTLTWLDVKTTLIFMHSIGEGVDNWAVYELTAGEWRSVILW
jgi:hypothetical protein